MRSMFEGCESLTSLDVSGFTTDKVTDMEAMFDRYSELIIQEAQNRIHEFTEPVRTVYIGGGTYTISAGDDGIHSSSGLAIADGTINILKSYEGLEGLTIDILGGEISLTASELLPSCNTPAGIV